jgi:ERCC4-related helicase
VTKYDNSRKKTALIKEGKMKQKLIPDCTKGVVKSLASILLIISSIIFSCNIPVNGANWNQAIEVNIPDSDINYLIEKIKLIIKFSPELVVAFLFVWGLAHFLVYLEELDEKKRKNSGIDETDSSVNTKENKKIINSTLNEYKK